MTIFFFYSIKDNSVESKFAIDSFIIGSILTILFFVIKYAIKHYFTIKEETLKQFNEKLAVIKEGIDLKMYEHIKYDEDRYEEVKTLVESSSETVHLIHEWIVTGKIKIKKTV